MDPPSGAGAASSSSSSSSARRILSPSLAALLSDLAWVPSAALPTVLLQQPTIPSVILSALEVLARAKLAEHLSNQLSRRDEGAVSAADVDVNDDAWTCILVLLSNAAGNDDPSLVRRLIAGRGRKGERDSAGDNDAVVYFAVLVYFSGRTKQGRSLLPKLVDSLRAEQLLQEGLKACTSAIASENTDGGNGDETRKSCMIMAALFAVLPGPSPIKDSARRLGGNVSSSFSSKAGMENLAASLTAKYQVPPGEVLNGLRTKIAFLDLVREMLLRCYRQGDDETILAIVASLETSSVTSGAPESSTRSNEPLIRLSLLADLLLVEPALVNRIQATISAASEDATGVRSKANAALQGSQQEVADIQAAGALEDGLVVDLRTLGGGWTNVLDDVKRQDSQQATSDDSPEQAPGISPTLLSLLDAILPQLTEDKGKLQRILRRDKFKGKSDEEVVQLLLDDQEEGADGDAGEARDAVAKPQVQPQPTAAPPAPAASKPRANIFDSQPLDASRLLRGDKGKGKDASGRGSNDDASYSASSVPDAVKSSILSRLAAQRAAEDEAATAEWNPFADLQRHEEVGYEEELDDYDDGFNLSNSNGRSAKGSSGLDKEAAIERVLLLAYLSRPSLFAPSPSSRSDPARTKLRQDLYSASGDRQHWDDGMVESWAKMLDRDPQRRETLLEQAERWSLERGGDVGAAGEEERASDEEGEEDDEDGETNSRGNFGPERGRGGKILRGSHNRGGSGRGGGSSGRGGGRGSGGGHRGGQSHSSGQHSGQGHGQGQGQNQGQSQPSQRQRNNKERRGNAARSRGADRKMQQRMA